jgi:hypothetical protein
MTNKLSAQEKRTMIFDHNVWLAERILEEAKKIESGHYLHDIRSDSHRLKQLIKGADKGKYIKIGKEKVFTELLKTRSRLASSLYMQEKEIWQ